jgi:hypothetical protein
LGATNRPSRLVGGFLDESLSMFVGWLTDANSSDPSERPRNVLRKMKGKTVPSVTGTIAALPEPADAPEADLPAPLNPLLEAWSHRPVPIGRFRTECWAR